MVTSEKLITLALQPIDGIAANGKYYLLADSKLFALGRWRENAWRYPGGAELEFEPRYYYPATGFMTPAATEGSDG